MTWSSRWSSFTRKRWWNTTPSQLISQTARRARLPPLPASRISASLALAPMAKINLPGILFLFKLEQNSRAISTINSEQISVGRALSTDKSFKKVWRESIPNNSVNNHRNLRECPKSRPESIQVTSRNTTKRILHAVWTPPLGIYQNLRGPVSLN